MRAPVSRWVITPRHALCSIVRTGLPSRTNVVEREVTLKCSTGSAPGHCQSTVSVKTARSCVTCIATAGGAKMASAQTVPQIVATNFRFMSPPGENGGYRPANRACAQLRRTRSRVGPSPRLPTDAAPGAGAPPWRSPRTARRQPDMKKLLAALVVTAGALSIAGGGVGIALVDPTPTFGERVFISLEGGGLSKHTSDTITMTCVKNGETALHQSS